MYKYFLFLIVITFTKIEVINSNECNKNNNLEIGILENEYINYRYYLEYELSNYSYLNNLEYNISIVDNDISKYHIIFGEYYDLQKLNIRKIDYPSKLESFYNTNGIESSDNILPLDLDTFILLSRENFDEMYLEDLTKIYNPFYYTLGLSIKNKHRLIKIISYLNKNNELFNLSSLEMESNLINLKKIYKNINKDLINSDLDDVMNSYNNSENLFTLFTDGVLLSKDLSNYSFIPLPLSKYTWDKNKGYFDTEKESEIFSFFGFSAYINNTNYFDFICHLLDKSVRTNAFTKFNLEISPFSMEELAVIDLEISEKYKEILNKKNKNILKLNYEDNLLFYDLILKIISEQSQLKELIKDKNYFN